MRMQRIYLDTSVISHLDHADAPEKMADTQALWESFLLGRFKSVISNVTIEELARCPEPKRTELLIYLEQLDYELLNETAESLELADEYMQYSVLSEKSRVDCRHIAVATIHNCQYITSWNFKHFVNIKTISKVQAVNKMFGYPEINIFPPTMLLEGV